MVHFFLNNFSNIADKGSCSILVSKVNSTKTRAAAFLIFKDQDRLKCEYYIVHLPLDSNLTDNPSKNLTSALQFWQDLLSVVKGPVIIISDVEQQLTQGTTYLSKIDSKRSEKKLPKIKLFSFKVISSFQSKGDQNPNQSANFNEGTKNLLRGCLDGRESFKETVRKIISPSVKFSYIT